MQQLMTEHICRLGRNDPRVVTREQLIEMGVPISAGKTAGKTKPCGIFVHFKRKLEIEEWGECEGVDGPADSDPKKRRKRSRAQYTAWLQTVTERFRALGPRELEVLRSEVVQDYDERVCRQAEDEASASSFGLGAADCAVQNVVQSLGSSNAPVTQDIFEVTVREFLGLEEEARIPGFKAYEEVFRSMQLQDVFIEDEGAILESDKFEYRLFLLLLFQSFAWLPLRVASALVWRARASVRVRVCASAGALSFCTFSTLTLAPSSSRARPPLVSPRLLFLPATSKDEGG